MATPCPSCGAPNDDASRFCGSCGTPLSMQCRSCGSDVPHGARFCPACGTPTVIPGAATMLEERRLVTVLFADLAGFTERSDCADPEDVRRILVPFHAAAKEEIERFGGTLDKFIGDAAMGVFGAPVAHEDDPERAVRAALAIRDRVAGGHLPVRIAVHTGEAMVISGEGPLVGERVVGDVVNTASRLQSLAPEGSVIVGGTTERTTRDVIDYRALGATKVKGKAVPLAAWIATGARTDTNEGEEEDPPPFIGRTQERALLHDLVERAFDECTPRVVTVVGEPGIGKTRLVLELHDHLRSIHVGASWHRGRCRPFGESITFTPLEEIVRSIAGIPPGADEADVRGRLRENLAGLDLGADDRAWLAGRLGSLVGLRTDDDMRAANTDEMVSVWTSYLDAATERAPLTLVIDDLHWAEDGLLEFLERLLEHMTDVPLFVLCTARPEFLTRRPGWVPGLANATTIALSPLTDGEMTHLLTSLLVRATTPDEQQVEHLVHRAGGNPLYAREFVHMLRDRGESAGQMLDTTRSTGEPGVPDTVQALIAARLDALEASDRILLQTAAVVGGRFWRGALATIEGDDLDIESSLRLLQHRGLVRRLASSAIEGDVEFAFTHELIRDAAYGRLPRSARSRLHRETAVWLETQPGSGAGHADMVASHATRSLEFARAAGLDDEVPELETLAVRSLVAAGEGQVSLDAVRAAKYFSEALALAPPGAERAEIRRMATSLGWRSGGMTSEEALEGYRTAEHEARDAGDLRLTARVLRRIYYQLGLQGDTTGAFDVLERAIGLVEDDPEAEETLSELYACRSEAEMFAGRTEESLQWAERALALPRTQTVTLMALHLRGNARCEMGDLGGVDDLRQALAIAEASGVAIDIVTSYSYLQEWVGLEDGPQVALPMSRATVDLCERRGLEGQGMWARAESLWLLFDTGLWNEVLEVTADLGAWARLHGDTQIVTVADIYTARVLTHRGHPDVIGLVDAFLPIARQIEDLQVLAPALVVAVTAHAVGGNPSEVISLAREFDSVTATGPTEYREFYLPEVVRALLAVGDAETALQVVGERSVHVRRTRLAMASAIGFLSEVSARPEEAAKTFRDAASGWEAWGGRFEQAHALAGLARVLGASDVTGEADRARIAAGEIFDQLGVPRS